MYDNGHNPNKNKQPIRKQYGIIRYKQDFIFKK